MENQLGTPGPTQSSAEKLSFAGAVAIGFKKFLNFRGVASRREYWFFVLFTVLVSLVIGTLDAILFPATTEATDALALALAQQPDTLNMELVNAAIAESINATPLSNIAGIVYGIPLLTATVRRMRDAGFGAWWLLLSWVPFFTLILTLLPTKPKTSPSI
jgi:uncharacterized membrane protein YhaH (DUF805 family)